jgi:hypothetical protein
MPGPGDLPSIDGSLKTPGVVLDGNSKNPVKKPEAAGRKPATAGNAADSTTDNVQPDARQHADSRVPAAGQEDALGHRGYLLPDGHPSSPRNEDGSPRSAPAELRQLESAEETDTPESGRADAAADDGASAEWRAQLPRLQGLWEGHKERWPAEQRAPVDRSTDEEGSWRGDAPGQYLAADENIETEHAHGRLQETERAVTGTMLAVEAEVPGARLVGLEHRLKGIERFKEKVADEWRAMPDRSVSEIAGQAHDAVRYTYQLAMDRYVDGYWSLCGRVKEAGYELESSHNFWSDTQYKGINTRWRTEQGQLFELQFHTPESFEAKQLTHEAYERIRLPPPTISSAERKELRAFQTEVSTQITAPSGATDVPDYSKIES